MSFRSSSNSILRSRSQSTIRARSCERGNRLTKPHPSSRGASPAATNRRVAKLNLYLQRSARNSLVQLDGDPESFHKLSRHADIKRWDGNRRMNANWDSVRRDPELWFSNGDCLVHFYERGQSRRGPSLRVLLEDLEASNCGPLLDQYLSDSLPQRLPSSSSDSDGYLQSPDDSASSAPPVRHELYIPAPTHLSRENAFRYHLTTRNFFAWLYEKPLVGDRLGASIIDLYKRLDEFRPDPKQNLDDVLAYIDNEGYSDFRDCPDHALAVLQFAEEIQDRELWTDAFVHCAGMWEQLDRSAEFEHISRTSQALISRAHLEMDLRLERAGAALGNFLEDDLSGAYLGLGKEAQLHLERFRSFLHSFYVGKHGYWPPTSLDSNSSALPKPISRSMYFEFRNLYDYLVDSRSGISIHENKPVDGGICVSQNIHSYDRRYKYHPLPHPLPLVPKIPAQLSHGSALSRIFGYKQAKLDRRVAASAALCSATNSKDEEVMNCSLVREYLRFEKQLTMKEDTTVTCADARKARWILIYAILQTLISVTRAPQEVRDTEGVSYALCCQIAGTPPWQLGEKVKSKPLQEAVKRVSLRETLINLNQDMAVASAKPSPLLVIPKQTDTPLLPQHISVGSSLKLKEPQPIRTSSWDLLDPSGPNISQMDDQTESTLTLPSVPSISSIDYRNTSPDSRTSDPTTPSTTESGAGDRSRWSASSNSSDDGMEHKSVEGDDTSIYGDAGDDELPPKFLETFPGKKASFSSFRPATNNPEVEQYILS